MTNATGQKLTPQLINSLNESINKYASKTIFASTRGSGKTSTPLGTSSSDKEKKVAKEIDYKQKYWEAQWHIDSLYEERQKKAREEDEDGKTTFRDD